MPWFGVSSGSNNIARSDTQEDMLLICDATVPWAEPPPPPPSPPAACLAFTLPSVPSPVHRKLASNDPHQTSRKEARGPGKQVLGGGCWGSVGKEEWGRGGREGGCYLFFMGGVPSWGLCHFGLVPLAPPIGFLTSPTLCGNLHPTFLLILYFCEPPELMPD